MELSRYFLLFLFLGHFLRWGETFFKTELFGLFWSGGGAFLCGEGVFLFCSGGGGVFLGGDFDVILSSGGGSFFGEGDFVFFFDVGGHP